MLKRISVDQVRVGMYIQELCCSWLESPFWTASFLLSNDADLHKLLSSTVREVWIDTTKGRDLDRDPGPAQEDKEEDIVAPSETSRPQLPMGIREDLVRARKIIQTSRDAVAAMFDEARLGTMFGTDSALSIVEEISATVQRNLGAFLGLARIKQSDDYTYMHSVAVSAMMIALARQLRMSADEIRDCGLAGLLHDIGKVGIPASILNKPGRLTDDEFLIVRNHPKAGYDLLSPVAGMPMAVLDVCLHHHERADGNGYPEHLDAAKLSVVARMGAICDVYDAITSNRPYKSGWSPAISLSKMATWAKEGHFDESIFQAFVECIGIYPVGTMVRLKSNRLAIVIDNSKSLLKPTIKVFFSIPTMAYTRPIMIDLAEPGTNDAISSIEDHEKWQIENLERLWVES